jgi:hypothetical protein
MLYSIIPHSSSKVIRHVQDYLNVELRISFQLIVFYIVYLSCLLRRNFCRTYFLLVRIMMYLALDYAKCLLHLLSEEWLMFIMYIIYIDILMISSFPFINFRTLLFVPANIRKTNVTLSYLDLGFILLIL